MTEIVSEEQLSPKYIVDVTKPSHVAWWAAAFEVQERALIEAVEAVGRRPLRCCAICDKTPRAEVREALCIGRLIGATWTGEKRIVVPPRSLSPMRLGKARHIRGAMGDKRRCTARSPKRRRRSSTSAAMRVP